MMLSSNCLNEMRKLRPTEVVLVQNHRIISDSEDRKASPNSKLNALYIIPYYIKTGKLSKLSAKGFCMIILILFAIQYFF